MEPKAEPEAEPEAGVGVGAGGSQAGVGAGPPLRLLPGAVEGDRDLHEQEQDQPCDNGETQWAASFLTGVGGVPVLPVRSVPPHSIADDGRPLYYDPKNPEELSHYPVYCNGWNVHE